MGGKNEGTWWGIKGRPATAKEKSHSNPEEDKQGELWGVKLRRHRKRDLRLEMKMRKVARVKSEKKKLKGGGGKRDDPSSRRSSLSNSGEGDGGAFESVKRGKVL